MIEHPAALPFQITFSTSPPASPLSAQTLACIRYGRESVTADDPRIIPVPLTVLAGPGHAEMWSGMAPARVDISHRIRHADNGEVLFGWLHLEEASLAPMENAVRQAYTDIQKLQERMGFPHCIRVWNYLADITGGEGDAERYRQFTVGRYHALALNPDFERQLPAATAIGFRSRPDVRAQAQTHRPPPGIEVATQTRGGGLIICFLATRRPGLQIENPRQTSAFQYPREYGPKSPSFSRATLQHWHEYSVLFLSGTASIVGHATQGVGDANRQLDETLANIDALLAHATRLHFPHAKDARFTPHSFKVYVRSAQVLAALSDRLKQDLGTTAPITVLEGDLCRRELLLEVEALYGWK